MAADADLRARFEREEAAMPSTPMLRSNSKGPTSRGRLEWPDDQDHRQSHRHYQHLEG